MLADDCANLEQAGLRGLLRVIGAEHPHLRATQIDLDEHTDAELLARQLLSGSDEDETAWRRRVVHGAVVPRLRCAPRSGEPPSSTTSTTGCACRSARPATCKRWNSSRSTALRRGRERSRSRSARPASTSPTCWSRSAAYPSFEGRLPQLGTDFAGVVTAVGPDVTDHQVGDHVGGMSPERLLGHVRHLRCPAWPSSCRRA